MTAVITSLTVDARGAEAGSAIYVRAMNAAQAAVDRLLSTELTAQRARDAGTAAMVGVSARIDKIVRDYEKLRQAADPSIAAAARFGKEYERALLVTDAAVNRLKVSQVEATRVFEQYVNVARQAYQNSGSPTGNIDAAKLLGIDLSGKSARESAAAFEKAFGELEEIARLKAEQVGRAFQEGLNEHLGVNAIGKSARDSAAVFAAEFDRLGAIAQQKAEQIGADFQRGLNESMGIGKSSKSARDSAAVFEQQFGELEEIARLKAQQIGRAFQDSLNASFGVGGSFKSARDSAAVFQEVFIEEERLTQATANLRAQINPLGTAFDRLGKELSDYQMMAAKGLITQDELSRASQLAVTRFNNFERSIQSAAKGGRFMSGEIVNLSYQLNDVLTGIALGQSPFMILAQQGGQVYQILASSSAASGPGGIIGAVKELGVWLLGLVTPAGVAMAAIAALGVTAIYGIMRFQSQQREITLALVGIGRAGGLSAKAINEAAVASSAALGLSSSEAREFATVLAATGAVGRNELGTLTKLGHDFAATFNTDAAGAAKALAEAMSDPAKGADELNKRLGFLDAAQQRMIRNLMEQNRLMEAQKIVIAGLQSSLARASDVTGFWAKTWTLVSNAVSGAADIIGRTQFGFATIVDAVGSQGGRLGFYEGVAKFAQGAAKWLPEFTGAKAAADQLAASVKNLKDAYEAEQKAETDAAKARRDSLRAAPVYDVLVPEDRARQALQNIQSLFKGLADTVEAQGDKSPLLAALGLTREQLDKARSIADFAFGTFKSQVDKTIAQTKISIDAITAFSPAAKGDIAYRQVTEQFAGTNTDPKKVQQQAELARVQALKQAYTQLAEAARERELAGEQGIQTAILEVALVGKTVAEQEHLRGALQARQQVEREAATNRIDADEDHIRRLQEQVKETARLKQLEVERKLLSDAAFERNQLFRGDIDQQVASRLRTVYGDKYGAEMDGVLARQLRFNEQLKLTQELASSALAGFSKDIARGVAPLDAAVTQLQRLNDLAIDMAAKQVVTQALGAIFGGVAETATQSAGATTAATILTTAGATVAASFIAGATEAAGILGLGIPTAAASMPIAGAVTGEELALGGGAAGAALATGGAAAGAAIWGPIALLMAAVAAAAALAGLSGASAERERQRAAIQGYRDRATLARTDTSTLEGSLSEFDLRAAAERSGLRGGGYTTSGTGLFGTGFLGRSHKSAELIALEEAQAAERLRLIEDFGERAVEAERQAAEDRLQLIEDFGRALNEVKGLSFLNDFADLFKQIAAYQTAGVDPTLLTEFFTLSAQQIVDDAELVGSAFDDLIAQFPQLTGVVHEFVADMVASQEKLNSVARGIVDYVNGLLAGSSSPLSPAARLSAAQSSYNAQLTLAQGGNVEAQSSITKYAEDLRQAAQAQFGSASGYQTIFNQITSQLLALPAVQNATDPVVTALTSVLNAIVAGNAGQLTQAQIASLGLASNVTLGTLLTQAQLSSLGLASNVTVGTLLTASQLAAQGLASNATLGTVNTSVGGVTTAVNTNTTAVGTNTTAVSGVNTSVTGVTTTLGTTNTNTANTATNVGATDAQGVRALLNQIKVLNTTSSAQLDLLNAQYATANISQSGNETIQGNGIVVNTLGNPLAGANQNIAVSNSMLSALNKIVYNTFAIAENTYAGTGFVAAGTRLQGVYAQGGWVGGNAHELGGSPILAERGEFVVRRDVASASPWLSEFNRTGRMPANDNGAVVGELRAMRQEIGTLLARIADLEASGNRTREEMNKRDENWQDDERRNRPRAVAGRA